CATALAAFTRAASTTVERTRRRPQPQGTTHICLRSVLLWLAVVVPSTCWSRLLAGEPRRKTAWQGLQSGSLQLRLGLRT
ncbi:MAG: hypothetical protein NZM07_05045, partial [Elioraea sp.]|nr:hypothetical protein [Elioraea sp.]